MTVAVVSSTMVSLISGSIRSRRHCRRHNLSMMMSSIDAPLYSANCIVAGMVVLRIGAGVNASVIMGLRKAGIYTVGVMVGIRAPLYSAVSARMMMGRVGTTLYSTNSVRMMVAKVGTALHSADNVRMMVARICATSSSTDHIVVIVLCRICGYNSVVVGKTGASQHSSRA